MWIPSVAAATAAGTGAVENTRERAALTSQSINVREPAMKPPDAPTALPSVPR